VVTLLGYFVVLFFLCVGMKNREKPFQLKLVVTIHNIVCTVLSAYMMFDILRQAIRAKYSLWGNAVDFSDSGIPMARALWLFYVSKVVEFGDTFIMALKQNFHQISFLHVYHHSSIFVIWWIVVTYAPGGDGYFSSSLNSFIHVLMYSYYLWAGIAGKPRGEKPVWTEPAYYKRYITTMQMAQFCVMLLQATYDLIVPNDYPKFCTWILFLYMISMLVLFANFYRQAYAKGGAKSNKRGGHKATMNGIDSTNKKSKSTKAKTKKPSAAAASNKKKPKPDQAAKKKPTEKKKTTMEKKKTTTEKKKTTTDKPKKTKQKAN